jgi:hypothetical protein
MSWSQQMREARRGRMAQPDMLDQPVLSYKLVCDGLAPLTNRMVKARRPHRCATCPGGIAAGERVRRETRRSADGKKIETRHVCASCCAAILDGEYPWRAAA